MQIGDQERASPPSPAIPTATADPNIRQSRTEWTVPAFVAHAFAVTGGALRARVLRRLLRPVGPLALAAISGGAFFKLAGHVRTLSVDDAMRVSAGQVYELASYVQQSSPDAVEQVLEWLAHDGSTLTALGVSVATIALGFLARRPAKAR